MTSGSDKSTTAQTNGSIGSENYKNLTQQVKKYLHSGDERTAVLAVKLWYDKGLITEAERNAIYRENSLPSLAEATDQTATTPNSESTKAKTGFRGAGYNDKTARAADYIQKSIDQLYQGNYTDKVTVLGTGMQLGAGFTGLDAAADIRDLTYDLTHWENTPGHVGQTLLDAAGLLPVVGSLKYIDEVGTLANKGSKAAKAEGTAAEESINLAENTLKEGAGDLLPNVEKFTVDTRKVAEYALNPNNTSGGANKARVFESALGYNQSNSNHLMQQIQSKLPTSKVILGTADKYGQRFTVDIPITGPNSKAAIVRTGWILEPGSDVPRMTTIFVK